MNLWIALGLGIPVLLFASLPLIVLLVNLNYYRRPGLINSTDQQSDDANTWVSILIPARDEEERIAPLIESIQRQEHVHWELLILDDHSTDNTATLVQSYADKDQRIRLIHGPILPAHWAGKQHACYQLSQQASHELMLFIDADLRLDPTALAALVHEMQLRPETHLLSGVPRQLTGSMLEQALIPLIHVILLGYLPMWWMHKKNDPSYGAGCGQLFLARREAYQKTQGHGHLNLRASFHDGLHLPRLFRDNDFHTDLIDATPLMEVRMYEDDGSLWKGLRKNAHAGLGSHKAITPWTMVLSLGHILAWPLLVLGIVFLNPILIALTASAIACNLMMRVIMALRFKQNLLSILLHSPGMFLLLIIQWQALWRHRRGKKESWRNRAQPQAA